MKWNVKEDMVLDNSRIIDVDKFRKRKENKINFKNSFMDYEETSQLAELFLLMSDIIESMFMDIEDIIKQAGLNPAEFTLMPDCEKDFLSVNYYKFFMEHNQAVVLSYQANIDEYYYNASAYAVIDEDNAVVEGAICKCDDEHTYLYNFSTGAWEECDGEEFPDSSSSANYVSGGLLE